jgi:hypothetical protein
LKITEAAQNYGQRFSAVEVMLFEGLTKNEFGCTLGDSFKNASGHPVQD